MSISFNNGLRSRFLNYKLFLKKNYGILTVNFRKSQDDCKVRAKLQEDVFTTTEDSFL